MDRGAMSIRAAHVRRPDRDHKKNERTLKMKMSLSATTGRSWTPCSRRPVRCSPVAAPTKSRLEKIEVIDGPQATHVRYRVVRCGNDETVARAVLQAAL